MKPILFLLSLILSTTACSQENPWISKLPFKNATIHYEVSGMMSGHKTLFIKDYGQTTAMHSETSMTIFGIKQPNRALEITTPDWIYTYDLIKKSGRKQANPNAFFIAEFNALSANEQKKVAENAEKFGTNTMNGLQGEVEKNAATLLGFKCDKTNMMGTEVFTMREGGIPLKVTSNTMGVQSTEQATHVDKKKVSDRYFKRPENIKLHHDTYIDERMQQQAKSVIQNLLAGNPPFQGTQTPIREGRANPGKPMDGTMDKTNPELQEQMKQMLKMFGG